MLDRVINVLFNYSFILLLLSLVLIFCSKSNKEKIKVFLSIVLAVIIFIGLFLIVYKYKFEFLDFYLNVKSLILEILNLLDNLNILVITLIGLLIKIGSFIFILGLGINYSTFFNRIVTINLLIIYFSFFIKIYIKKVILYIRKIHPSFKPIIYKKCYENLVLNC